MDGIVGRKASRQMATHFGPAHQFGERRVFVSISIPANRAAAGRVGKDEQADLLPVVAGYHHVLHQRSAGCKDFQAKLTNVHPGAGRQLEVFGEAAVKKDSLPGVARAADLAPISSLKKSILIEDFPAELRTSPISGSHVWTFDSQLQLVFNRRQLDLGA